MSKANSMGDSMEKDAKMIAAVSAVMHYLKEEEDVILFQASAQPQISAAASVSAPAPSTSQWALGGRYDHMQTRALMQLKAFHR
jgi:hypothetical protein